MDLSTAMNVIQSVCLFAQNVVPFFSLAYFLGWLEHCTDIVEVKGLNHEQGWIFSASSFATAQVASITAVVFFTFNNKLMHNFCGVINMPAFHFNDVIPFQ